MSNVVGIGGKTVEFTPQEKIVDALTEWLEMARAGHITAIQLAGIHVDGDVLKKAWWAPKEGVRLLGAVDWAHDDLRQEVVGKS